MDQCTHEVRAEYWKGIIRACGQRPAGQQFMELYNKPEFQKMQQVMSSPGFQTAIEAANKIQKNLNWGKKQKSNNNKRARERVSSFV